MIPLILYCHQHLCCNFTHVISLSTPPYRIHYESHSSIHPTTNQLYRSINMHFPALLILGAMVAAQTIASTDITTSTSTSNYCPSLGYVFDKNCWNLDAENDIASCIYAESGKQTDCTTAA